MFDTNAKYGFLARASLKEHMLIEYSEGTEVIIDPYRWIKTDSFIREFGETPVVMVVDVDVLEIYYRILLGEKHYWFPVTHVEEV